MHLHEVAAVNDSMHHVQHTVRLIGVIGDDVGQVVIATLRVVPRVQQWSVFHIVGWE